MTTTTKITIGSLILLTVFSFFLRLYKIESLPGILNRDEAGLAYNAVLLHQVGQDEWGRSWPLALESFGDYKLPGYSLLLVVAFNIFPYQDWVVRLPAVIAGSSLLPLTYFLARNWKFKKETRWFATLSVACTPVFFFYSRMAFESLVALSLWLLAINLIIWNPKQKIVELLRNIATVIIVLLACFTYNTPFLLLPFLILLVPLITQLKNWKKWSGLCASLLFVFVGVAFVLIPLTSQKSGITIFSDETTLTNSISYRKSLHPFLQPVIGSKYIYFSSIILKNLVLSFSPHFMILKGGAHPWHSLPNAGNIAITSYLLGILGLFSLLSNITKQTLQLVKSKRMRSIVNVLESRSCILLFLLITSLAPSIITIDAPHTTRSLSFFFWWIFVSVEGLIFLSAFLKKYVSSITKKTKKKASVAPLLLSCIVLLLVVEFSIYSYKYFYTYPQNQPGQLKLGFNAILEEAEEKYLDEEIAVVDGDGYLYIVAAWYLKLSAEEYFSSIVRQQADQIGFKYGEQLKNYHFIADPNDREKTNERIMLNWNQNTWSIESF